MFKNEHEMFEEFNCSSAGLVLVQSWNSSLGIIVSIDPVSQNDRIGRYFFVSTIEFPEWETDRFECLDHAILPTREEAELVYRSFCSSYLKD